jgi:hypothetical protein
MSEPKATVEREEWVGEQSTTLFGVTKSAYREKAKTPGTKALPIHEQTFERIKALCKGFREFRPAVDMPEMVSAMAELVMRDAALSARLGDVVIGLRQAALDAAKGTLQKSAKP